MLVAAGFEEKELADSGLRELVRDQLGDRRQIDQALAEDEISVRPAFLPSLLGLQDRGHPGDQDVLRVQVITVAHHLV